MLLWFLGGVIIGSFLGLCSYRLPRKQSVLWPRSRCPICQAPLSGIELLPIVGYVMCGGACRYCKSKISGRYLLLEIGSGIIFSGCYYQFNCSSSTIFVGLFSVTLLLIAVIDYEWQLVLDRVLLWLLILGFVSSTVCGFKPGWWLAMLVAGVLLLVVVVFSAGGFGYGDVKLGVVLGLWLGWPDILWVLWLAFVSGGILGASLLVLGVCTGKDKIAFAPFLCGAAMLVLFYAYELNRLHTWLLAQW